MDLHLDGRIVMVTGGSSGIGLALVERLIAEGASVATCARDLDRLRGATEHLPAERLFAAACDVTDTGQVERFVDGTAERFAQLDGLVLNAGRSRLSRFGDTSSEDWRDELDLKFGGVLNPMHAALPLLESSDAAAVVVMNAVLARQPEPHLVATSAARAGLLNLARSLATELAPEVRVNSILLGLIDTGQWRRRYEDADTGDSFEAWSARIASERRVALGRFGTADEVAAVASMLLSRVSSYVTGATVEISGGAGRYV